MGEKPSFQTEETTKVIRLQSEKEKAKTLTDGQYSDNFSNTNNDEIDNLSIHDYPDTIVEKNEVISDDADTVVDEYNTEIIGRKIPEKTFANELPAKKERENLIAKKAVQFLKETDNIPEEIKQLLLQKLKATTEKSNEITNKKEYEIKQKGSYLKNIIDVLSTDNTRERTTKIEKTLNNLVNLISKEDKEINSDVLKKVEGLLAIIRGDEIGKEVVLNRINKIPYNELKTYSKYLEMLIGTATISENPEIFDLSDMVKDRLKKIIVHNIDKSIKENGSDTELIEKYKKAV